MKTLLSWVALLLPMATLADGPPPGSQVVVECRCEFRDIDGEESKMHSTAAVDVGGKPTVLGGIETRSTDTTADATEDRTVTRRKVRKAELSLRAVGSGSPQRYEARFRMLGNGDEPLAEVLLSLLAGVPAEASVKAAEGQSIRVALVLSDPHPPAREADRQTSDGPSKEERRIAAALEKKVSLHFEDVPLHKVMAEIRSIGDINIVIDNAGLEQEGVTSDTPVSLDVDDVTLRSALTLLLEPFNLTHVSDKEVLKVTSKMRAKGPLTVETYPVADLVPALRFVPAGGETAGKADEVRPAAAIEAEPTGMEPDDLLDLITGAIQPGSWVQVGGYGVIRVNEATGSLVVRQTRDVHEEIADLLRHLRRLRDAAARQPEP